MKKYVPLLLALIAVAALGLTTACESPMSSDEILASSADKPERFVETLRTISSTVKDAYENDDSKTAAKTITVDAAVQEHNFYDDATDWLKFTAVSGTTYTIESWVFGSADTQLYLYSGSTLKASNDDKASGNYGSLISYTATSSGTLYIKAYSYGAKKGSSRNYNISVTTSGGGGGSTGVTLPQPSKSWTVVVYLDGDNSLSSYTTADIAEMYGVGSDAANINIVALWDNSGSTHGYYYVESGAATLLTDVGEVNMGLPATANTFIDYVTTNFPATNYAWIWWNHGGAVDRGVCWDDTSDDHISEVEQLSIMEYFTGKIGKKIEVVGFDACLMATAEIYYQYKDVANYIAASEQTEPGNGWDYSFLSYVKANPANGGEYFVQKVLDKYEAYYASESDITFSAVDLSLADELGVAIDAFADAAIASGISGNTFKSLAANVSDFSGYTKDLYYYMGKVYASSSMTTAVKTAAAAVQTAITNMVIDNFVGSTWTGKGYGCSITMLADTTTYSLLDICVDTSWDEFCTFAGF